MHIFKPRASRLASRALRHTSPETNITFRALTYKTNLSNHDNKMALFARDFYDDDMSFAPVFRFIDAFDNWNTRANTNRPQGQGRSSVLRAASFNPKFDVVETKDSYELHGEIPGVERKDISIEFTEPQMIVIHGRVERKYTSGTPPAGLVEGQKAAGAMTEGGESVTPPTESHKATVTDEEAEEAEAAKERGSTDNNKQQQVAKTNGHNKPAHHGKFWCQERSVGEFHRTFSFPVPVDEANVKASLDNGILHLSIPKQEKRASRRVEIS